MLTYGSDNWPLKRKDENMLRILERRIVRRIYDQIKENRVWRLIKGKAIPVTGRGGPYGCETSRRSRHNHEIYKLYNKPDTVEVIKVGRLRWLGQLLGMQEQNPCRKSTLHQPERTRRVGTPAVRWLDSVEEDLRKMNLRNCRQKSQVRD
jgi:hypothetical protein